MSNELSSAGIVSFDFQRIFPHIFWISSRVIDKTYPDGVIYKILSVRDEYLKTAELVLIRSLHDGRKEILHRANVPLTELENAAHIFVDGLTKQFHLTFEEQNYENVKKLQEFHKITEKYGWSMKDP